MPLRNGVIILKIDSINQIVDSIYFETIGCPEKGGQEHLKKIIRSFLLHTLAAQCDEDIDAINKPLHQWDKTESYRNSPGNDEIVNRIIHMISDTGRQELIDTKEYYSKLILESE